MWDEKLFLIFFERKKEFCFIENNILQTWMQINYVDKRICKETTLPQWFIISSRISDKCWSTFVPDCGDMTAHWAQKHRPPST